MTQMPARRIALPALVAPALVALALLALAAPAGAATLPRAAAACPAQYNVPRDAAAASQSVRCLLNAVRRSHGLKPLRRNFKLERAAGRYTSVMVRSNCFGHTCGASMSRRLLRTGYARGGHGFMLGENLGWGTGSHSTPRAMTTMWMRSPGHRANILGRSFREIGVSVKLARFQRAGRAGVYTVDFGRRF